jgi:hypothetical protein
MAWIESGRHIFDADMNWIAYLANNQAGLLKAVIG